MSDIISTALKIPVTIYNPGSEHEFYAYYVFKSDAFGDVSETRYFRLDENGRAIPHLDRRFGSVSISTYISDPF